MIIRIKFTKEEPVKYLGHLDILRFFQKCFVRAGVKMFYSEGFNPHQKMSFALPLGVGITSRAEYLDAEIEEGQDLSDIKKRMNAASGSGFEILEIKQVKEMSESLMSIVRFASYEVAPFDEQFFVPEDFINQEHISVIKRTKKGSREVDIKPLAKKIAWDGTLKLFLSAGSENNLKPELLLEAICAYNKSEYKRENFKIVRSGLYGPGKIDLIDINTL